jgi:hypothetical protein
MAETRSTRQRVTDVLEKLQTEDDLWVASASAKGAAYLIPLSFSWDGDYVTVVTPSGSRTARNLRRAGWARMAMGPTLDVVMLDGPVEELALDDDEELASTHARRVGFDGREEPEDYVFIRLRPSRIQAWRSAEELRNRDVMRDGVWLA